MPAPAPDPSEPAHPLRRAIRLAMNGRGGVEPNPMVGCVITANSVLVGIHFQHILGSPFLNVFVLDRNSQVSFHKTITKAAVAEFNRARWRALTAA